MLLWSIVFSESVVMRNGDEMNMIGPQWEPPHTILVNGMPVAFTVQLKDNEANNGRSSGKNVHPTVEHRVRHGRRQRRR